MEDSVECGETDGSNLHDIELNNVVEDVVSLYNVSSSAVLCQIGCVNKYMLTLVQSNCNLTRN